ncbi:hypothetical protein NM208_g14097 [Fusarium decemcellulare]|uniref:Uncharacterized protein n=1 Tax=Fusarium decemcellulare TaxID=57161 RepID=A0ACC1RIT4_9HYPO|nr:hypothetical protein NM208_g14097 [Fusarium decemcellulare]
MTQAEGPNDGLVSVESSHWGTYKGTLLGVSHLDLINWSNRVGWTMALVAVTNSVAQLDGPLRLEAGGQGKTPVTTMGSLARCSCHLATHTRREPVLQHICPTRSGGVYVCTELRAASDHGGVATEA